MATILVKHPKLAGFIGKLLKTFTGRSDPRRKLKRAALALDGADIFLFAEASDGSAVLLQGKLDACTLIPAGRSLQAKNYDPEDGTVETIDLSDLRDFAASLPVRVVDVWFERLTKREPPSQAGVQ